MWLALPFGDWVALVLGWAVVSIGVILSVYDFVHYILPREYVVAFGVVGFVDRIWSIASPTVGFATALLDPLYALFGPVATNMTSALLLSLAAVSSVLLALPLYLVWRFSLGRLVGFGDVLLVAAIGIMLGWVFGLVAFVVACWVGALVGIMYGTIRHIASG